MCPRSSALEHAHRDSLDETPQNLGVSRQRVSLLTDIASSKGLEQLLSAYHAAGLQRVTCRFYPEARHELFNETNRDEVARELLAWLDEATGHGEYSRRGRPQPAGRRSWA